MGKANALEIKNIPMGEAPEEVKKRWVGRKMPLAGVVSEANTLGVMSHEPVSSHEDGYKVLIEQAIVALIDDGETDAAQFWAEWMLMRGYPLVRPDLVFNKESGDLIELKDGELRSDKEAFMVLLDFMNKYGLSVPVAVEVIIMKLDEAEGHVLSVEDDDEEELLPYGDIFPGDVDTDLDRTDQQDDDVPF